VAAAGANLHAPAAEAELVAPRSKGGASLLGHLQRPFPLAMAEFEQAVDGELELSIVMTAALARAEHGGLLFRQET
jgi:hypothetical protein